MRILLFGLIALLFSCTHIRPREFASIGPVALPDSAPDHQHSFLKLFPSESDSTKNKTLFYLELKNSQKKLVDIDPTNLRVEYQSQRQELILTRLSHGRFSISLEGSFPSYGELKFLVHDEVLEHQFVISVPPSKKRSSLQMLETFSYETRFQIDLRDELGMPVEVDQYPEVIHDGPVQIKELKLIRKGIWEFILVYPEENQFFYISIRANGVLLEKLYRFQHVEK